MDPTAVECKGIRSTSDFPRDLSGLSPEQIAHHYSAMRNSHASLVRARGQLQRRSRELREARDRFLDTLHGYEQRYVHHAAQGSRGLRFVREQRRVDGRSGGVTEPFRCLGFATYESHEGERIGFVTEWRFAGGWSARSRRRGCTAVVSHTSCCVAHRLLLGIAAGLAA